MIYTSGTTGHPKGVRRAPATVEQAKANAALLELVYGLTPGVRGLVTGPLYHASPNAYGRQALMAQARRGDVVVLGDSYSQGACVPQDKIPASILRKRYPKTLTLGMCANGPLMEYADLKELAADLKPRIVLWVYYNNDLSDMDVEAQSELLMRYVDDDGFRQGLAARQPAIDAALERYLGNIAARAPRWPGALAGMGLTRQSTPLVLQDLVKIGRASCRERVSSPV